MTKGDDTRRRILDLALAKASMVGFEGLSIGALAREAEMSKSGLFAHFRSKEDLQVQALRAASDHFVEWVVSPALRAPRGLPRVRAMFELWMTWEEGRITPGGCPFVVAAYEYDDRPGPVRDAVVAAQRDWFATLQTALQISIEEGHLRPDTDVALVAQEVYGAFLSFHFFHRLLRDPEARERAVAMLERIIASALPAEDRHE